jgi:DNA polymerase-1
VLRWQIEPGLRALAAGGAVGHEMAAHVAEDAIAAAKLFPLQVAEAVRHGLSHHLEIIEMPWVRTNARITWNGVRIDQDLQARVADACSNHLPDLQRQLEGSGITNLLSHRELVAFFRRAGLLDLFRRNGIYCFDKDQLQRFRDRHPAIPVIRAARRVLALKEEPLFANALVGSDGRVHPDHRQLGTHTGRQTCRAPNLLGLDRVLRPLVVPGPGRGIGEVDWAQVEVGIAGAVYKDSSLVEMFNTGDVYSAMAQHFYRDKLSESERCLKGPEFKRQRPEFRERMKTCTLGIIYRMTAMGLALQLGIGQAEAENLQSRFMSMFAELTAVQAKAVEAGLKRGYGCTPSGLRRYRADRGKAASAWEVNWMANFPVQGAAAAVFKDAGNRLDRLFRRHDAFIIVPFHDAFVFEAPREAFEEVKELTARVMCQTLEEHFPVLRPRVEINAIQPECWNKDGRADALERWLDDATFSI